MLKWRGTSFREGPHNDSYNSYVKNTKENMFGTEEDRTGDRREYVISQTGAGSMTPAMRRCVKDPLQSTGLYSPVHPQHSFIPDSDSEQQPSVDSPFHSSMKPLDTMDRSLPQAGVDINQILGRGKGVL